MGKRIGGIVILAGGTAKRLGGVSKPDLDIAGRRLIDIVFDQLDAIGFTGQRIVVAPADVDVPRGVQLTLEDPPHGGPLAGIGAGVRALDVDDDDLVAIATCDAPVAVRLLPKMADVLSELMGTGAEEPAVSNFDGVVPLNEDGWPQYTHGLYRAGALRSQPFERDGSVRRALGALHLATILDEAGHCLDVDEPEDVPALIAHLARVENIG